MTVYNSVLEMIGNTPIVDLSQLSPNPNVRILGKMEGQNPAGSVKDRIALSMITEAEAEGRITPGCTILEPSSGNTGIAMAMICRIRGYHLKIVLPGNVSIERRQLLTKPQTHHSAADHDNGLLFCETHRPITLWRNSAG